MNPVVVQSIWTAVSAVIFAGIVLWAFTRGAAREFRDAERLPFLDEAAERPTFPAHPGGRGGAAKEAR